MKKRTLSKKLISLLLASVFVLTSCGQKRPPEDYDDPNSSGIYESESKGFQLGGDSGTDDSIPENNGNSKAIDIKPCEGIHVTAEKNAFWKDTDITFKPVDNSTKNINKIEQTLYDDGILAFAAFEVEAGLDDKEFMPGQYNVEYDLSTLNIDQSFYEVLKVYRVGDDGQYYELSTNLEGNTLKFSCDQNSVVVVGTVTLLLAGSLFAIGETIGRNWYYIRNWKTAMRYDGKNDYGSYCIEWTMQDVDPDLKTKLQKMTEIEKVHHAKAEEYRKDIDIFYRFRSNYEVAKFFRESVEADPEHKKLRDQIRLPDLIKEEIKCIDNAFKYLYREERMRMPLHTVSFKNLMAEKENKTYAEMDPGKVITSQVLIYPNNMDAGKLGLYNLQLTVTHELLHVCQNRYHLPLSVITDMTRYDEMIAQCTESDALAYFKRLDIIPESAEVPLTRTDSWANLRSPINGEEDSIFNNKWVIDCGYNLGSFLRYLINKTGKRPTAHQMMKARSLLYANSVSKTLQSVFGIDEREFDIHFRNWIIANREEINGLAFSYAFNNSDNKYPGTPRQTVVKKGQKYHINLIHSASYFLTLRCFETYNWEKQTMILVLDKELRDVFPSSNVLPGGDYKKINAGAYLSRSYKYGMKIPYISILEIQGDNSQADTSKDAGYTIYVLDKTPKVELAQKNELLYIKLPEPELIAKDGVCDGYTLKIVTDSGKKIEKDIKKDLFGKTLEMNKSLLFDNDTDTSVKITVTLNEFFMSSKDKVPGIESDKVTLTVDRQNKETKQTKQTGETSKKGEESPLGDAKVEHSNDGKKANGYWKLKEINVLAGKPTNSNTGWKTSYTATAYTHTYTDSHPKTKYMQAQYAKFVATCSKLPDKIIPGDKVIVKINLKMEDRATHLLSGHASMKFGQPNDERNGLKYNDGIIFFPTKKGAEHACSEDTCDNKHVPSVEVYYDFTQTGEKGDEIAILFYANSSNTLFIYEWVETK